MTQEEKDKLPKYRLMGSEGEVEKALKRSEGEVAPSSWKGLKDVSVISFQAAGEVNEDRYTVTSFRWPVQGSPGFNPTAHLLIVYDGHAGDLAVDHAQAHLPSFLRAYLTSLPTTSLSTPELVSDALKQAIESFDASFLSELTSRIPSWEEVENMSDEEVKALLGHDGGQANEWARKVGTGSCVVVGLVVGRDVWVAGLGDCEGVLAIKDQTTAKWAPQVMTTIQNYSNKEEVDQVKAAHPGEASVFLNGRFCGLILCSRALGDAWMKFPPAFTTRLMAHTEPVGRSAVKVGAVAKQRFLTPPYISSTPEVKHYRIPDGQPAGTVALMLSSDGFRDMPFPLKGGSTLEAEWAKVIGEIVESNDDEIGGNGLAAQLLRRSWQREDLHLASAMLGLPGKNLDDVTVMVAVI